MLKVQVTDKEKAQSKILGKILSVLKRIVKRRRFKKVIIIFLIVLILGVFYGFLHYYRKYQDLKADPDLEAQQEIESLQEAIGEFMDLPEGETPSVATILDKEKLKDQPFFENAENGDKLLVYTKAMKAILYRPSSNRIIEVAPLYIDPEDLEQQGQVQQTLDALTVAYYNGTETAGFSEQVEEMVKSTYPDYQTTDITDASRKDYTGTIVIDLVGNRSQEAADIANLLSGEVGGLPVGETRPDADILIISGG